MTGHSGWYPPGQVCYPPELPAYLRNVHNLQPIVGVPSDAEVIEIHDVMQAARKASEIPGMHDPGLIMKLGDHLFNVQMARYRSKYSLITFPSDATYTPPVLPAHVVPNLEPILGAPSDEEIIKVQDAIQIYQEFRRVPSMYDACVNMQLSQHLFDIQMARHMRIAGESPPSSMLQTTAAAENLAPVGELNRNRAEEAIEPTNNAGTGAKVDVTHPSPPTAHGSEMRELMGRSNQLAERFNQLLERSNELMERHTQPDHSKSQALAERFNQVLERLTQLVRKSNEPSKHSDQLAERFSELLERFDELATQQSQSAQEANELVARLSQSSERSNELAEQANGSWERMGVVLGNINRVLVRVQHAIVRNHKGNKFSALDCLVNEQGETPIISDTTGGASFGWLSKNSGRQPENRLPVVIDGASQDTYISDYWLSFMLRFYDIDKGMCQDSRGGILEDGMERAARERLGEYLSSCLG
ncbi:hypothetical protein OPQ81_005309 [Rhizoctonia solani]|nr:hypothetical protein OPQ81_005309 [Rhizoctonia solani]